jgi:hypothetical protein
MQRVERSTILDYVSYEERRPALRERALAIKAKRRVHVGPHLTFLFENADTVRYQVQEMMRAERIVREADIQHELDTYNDLLGGPGELGCTLLIEIDDAEERAHKLAAWIELPSHVYVVVRADNAKDRARGAQERVYARFDERQVGRGRLSSVQYLKFALGGRVPLAVGCDHPGCEHETALGPEQVQALEQDLAG